jgi:hypothetical protein
MKFNIYIYKKIYYVFYFALNKKKLLESFFKSSLVWMDFHCYESEKCYWVYQKILFLLYLVRQQLSLSSRSYESSARTAKDSLRAPKQKVKFLAPCVKEGMGQECVRTTFPSSNSKDNRNSTKLLFNFSLI